MHLRGWDPSGLLACQWNMDSRPHRGANPGPLGGPEESQEDPSGWDQRGCWLRKELGSPSHRMRVGRRIPRTEPRRSLLASNCRWLSKKDTGSGRGIPSGSLGSQAEWGDPKSRAFSWANCPSHKAGAVPKGAKGREPPPCAWSPEGTEDLP